MVSGPPAIISASAMRASFASWPRAISIPASFAVRPSESAKVPSSRSSVTDTVATMSEGSSAKAGPSPANRMSAAATMRMAHVSPSRWRAAMGGVSGRERAAGGLGRQGTFERAARAETARHQRPAEATAGVERDRELRLGETTVAPVEAAHDAGILAILRVDARETRAAPPETVALGGERPLRIDASMDEQQRRILGISGMTQRRHQLRV